MLSALGGLSGIQLKKTRPSTPWVDVNILSYAQKGREKSPTLRMRDIDGLRLHIPILEERDALKIPQSSERLILSDQMNIMMLCGGYAGVHFTAEEMNQLIYLASEFDKRFRILEDFFNTLSNTQKHYVRKSTAVPPPPPMTDTKEEISPSALPPSPPSENIEDQAIEYFHSTADSVIDILCQLQPLVRLKQTHVPSIGIRSPLSSSCNNSLEMIIADASSDSDLPSSAEYLPRPRWLETLITKYISHVPPTKAVACALPPVGTFAAFLSCCITEQIDCTKSEEEALHEVESFSNLFSSPQLIVASNDHHGRILLQTDSDIRNEIFSHTQKYWANRFYQFLKKLTEFKSAVKDEKSLYEFQKFL